jgi:hypothetical protein
MPERIFVVPRGDSWAVRREGAREDTSTHFTRAEAVDVGRGISERDRCQLVVHEVERRARPRESSQAAYVTAS